MKKILVVLSCFLFSSCFHITEKVKHNSNNSGDYQLVIDFSESWLKVKSAMYLEEVDGVSIPSEEEIKQKLSQFKNNAQKIKDLSDVKTSYDFKNYVFKVSFKYATVEALNKALNTMNSKEKFIHFSIDNQIFKRNASFPLPKNLVKNDDKKEDLLNATITSVYTFEKPVLKVENNESKVSKTKKTVFLKQNIWNTLKNTNLLNNTITLYP